MPVVSSPAPKAGPTRFWRRKVGRERRSSERAPLLRPPPAADGHARQLGDARSPRSGGLASFARRLAAWLRIGGRPDPARAADLQRLIDRDEEAEKPDEEEDPLPPPPDESLDETDDEEEEGEHTPPPTAPTPRPAEPRRAESHQPALQQCAVDQEQAQGRVQRAEQKNKGAVFVIDAMDMSNGRTFLGASHAAFKLVKAHKEKGLHAEKVKVYSIAGLCALLEEIAGGSLNLLPNDDSPVLIVLLIHGNLIRAGQNLPGRLNLGYNNDRILLAKLLHLLSQDKLHSSFNGTSGAPRLIHFAAIACRGLTGLASASALSDKEKFDLLSSYGSEAPDSVRLLTPCQAGEVILVDPEAGTAILDAYGEVLNNRLHDVESTWNAAVVKVLDDPDRLYQRQEPGRPWVTGENGVEMYRARPQRISTPTHFAWPLGRPSLAQPLVLE